MRIGRTISKNKWRYISFIAGFILFVAPFALLTRLTLSVLGSIAEPTLHTFCFRMPIDWIFGGRIFTLLGRPTMMYFTIAILGAAFVFSPLFCGWICPVGSISESLSRSIPLSRRFRVNLNDPKFTVAIRYGFLIGFIIVSMIVGLKLLANPELSSICCRYCASSVLQNLSYGIFDEFSALEYWHTGSILALASWLLIGGIFVSGGRGWCLFFCPLGALSGVFHKVGARLGFYRVEYDGDKCLDDCSICKEVCPMRAIDSKCSIERGLCITCKECVNLCPKGAFRIRKGK